MVKVFKCHNFKSQSVVQVDGEPIAFFNHKDKLFVATDKCTIEVFSLGSSISKISCFSTTEQTIHDIVFCYPGNYVATIESTYNRRSKKDVFYIKVYLNWEVASGKVKHRTAIRLAGKDQNVTTSAVDESHIQVIEIPYKDKIQDISICQKTGNLITVSKEITDVYHLVEKKILNSDRVYLDIVLFLQLEWHIGHVTKTVLCEDYIGVLSKRETQIVKVVYSDENLGRLQNVEADRLSSSERGFGSQHQKSSSVMSNVSFLSSKSSLSLPGTPQFSRVGCRSSANASPSLLLNKSVDSVSTIREDDHFVKINVDDLKLNQSHSSNKSIKTLHLKKLKENNCDKVLEPDVTDFRGGGHQTAGSIHVITVHHQKIKRAEDEFRHLQLIPSYISNISRLSTRVMLGSVPLRSVVYNSMVGISCFISSDSNGYVHDIWSTVSTQLSTYSYSDIPTQIVMNEDLLYVLTGRGLEIYTSRCGTAAIHHTERFNTKEKAFPSADMDTCLCGVHLFMNTVKLDVSNKYVIILSKLDGVQRSDEGSCSLYAVEKCSPGDLYKDMVKYGERSRKHNEGTYLNLLLEGHMTLRNTFIGGDINDREIEDLFRESCLLIGEYYAKEKGTDGQLCIPYLTMSGLSVADIIRQLVESHEKMGYQDYGQGFIAYLKHVLLQDGEPFELIEAEGDMILSICSKAIPDLLSDIILFSRVKEFNSEHALTLLQIWIKELASHGEKSSIADKLALTNLYLVLCDPEVAERTLLLIPKVDLMKICVQHNEILHDNFQQLSPLSQLMRRCCPSVLTQSMVALHDKGTISLDLAIQLLQGTNSSGEMFKNTHVKEYLEFLLNDTQRRYIFEEAVVLLSEIYIKRLADQKSVVSKKRTAPQVLQLPADEGHFGRRYNWLDYLSPFKGPEDMKQPCQYILRASPTTARKNTSKIKQHVVSHDFCNCGLCFEDLLKLQSLLCFSKASESLLNKVLELLDQDYLVPGHDSILILVLLKTNKQNATDIVVQKYPRVILEFGKCIMNSDREQRKIVLDSVYRALQQQIGKPNDNEPVYLQSLKDILDYLARTTGPEEFLNLLPDNGNFLFFLPYISMNCEKQKKNNLIQVIKNKGRQLQSTTS